MSDKSSFSDDAQFYSELLRAYFDSTHDAIFVLCDEMKFLTCNRTTEKWLGYTEDDLTLHNKRTPVTQLLGKGYDADTFNTFFENALKGQSISFETLIKPSRGEERWIEINMSRVDIENGDMVIAVARDITERKKHLAKIDYQTNYDELTGLPNRNFIIKYLDYYQQQGLHIKGYELVLLVLDLNRFKEINESMGHKTGDYVLQEIARRLSRVADASSNEIIARLGGDEFAVAFPNIELSQSRITALMIRQIISQPIIIEGKKLSADCAIGIAALPTHTDDSSSLIQLAESAMYNAKSQKLEICTYNAELADSSGERLRLVTDLRDALRKNHIKPYYQPIINMQTKALHVETLARWHHPQHGIISPDVFIPLAEETGSINKLTSIMMMAAFRDCASALRENLIESLSINISPYCLTNPKLLPEIKSYLKKYSISPGSITLEITESAMMSNLPEALKTINALYKFGLEFSIDDFGTGYSSLSKLKHMPVKELKIDKSFITDIESSENDSAITNAAIQMAHGMGLDVVAEGIESESIWNRLREMGCDYGQGYWITKPLPAKEFFSWMRIHYDQLKPGVSG